jgi:hypothetical protein
VKRVVAWTAAVAVFAAAALSVARRLLRWDEQPPAPPELAVEVVNAAGVDRAGRGVLLWMQSHGFDVRRIAGVDSVRESTVVRDLRDRALSNARRVAAALARRRRVWFVPVEGWQRPPVCSRVDSSRHADVQLVLGRDYRRFFPEAVPLR